MGFFSALGAGYAAEKRVGDRNAEELRTQHEANARARSENEALARLKAEQAVRAAYKAPQGDYLPKLEAEIGEATGGAPAAPTPAAPVEPAAPAATPYGMAPRVPNAPVKYNSGRPLSTSMGDRPIRATPEGVQAFKDTQTLRLLEKKIREGKATPQDKAAYASAKGKWQMDVNVSAGNQQYNAEEAARTAGYNQGEQQRWAEMKKLEAERAATPKTPAPAATTAPAAVSQYDIATPYDGLIQQAAQQYGVDPVILKRLLGSESSFNPTVVNPQMVNGENAVGIAQILPRLHGVTPQQAADPQFAIPFAAKLLAQKLQEAGGDYQQAVYGYKGAKTDAGRASVGKAMSDIFGPQGAPQAAPGQPTAAAPAPAQPQYQVTPLQPVDDQRFAYAQSQIARIDSLMQATRDIAQLERLQSARQTAVEQVQNMAVDRALFSAQQGDLRALGGVASHLRVDIGRLPDGRFVMQNRDNGEQTIANSPQRAADLLYRLKQRRAAESTFAKEILTHQHSMQLEQLKARNAQLAEMLKGDISAAAKIAELQAKGRLDAAEVHTASTNQLDGTVTITFKDGRMAVVSKVDDPEHGGPKFVSKMAQPS